MNEEYSEYLNSEAWQQKRMQRLAIAKFRCSACAKKKAVHVHHLTYERIFNEDMADLLPLCEDHHRSAEALIAKGELQRRGDVLFLATETLRLILQRQPERATVFVSAEARNPTQDRFLNDPKFLELLVLPRKKFKKAIKRFFGHRPKLVCNALVLYDRKSSIRQRPQAPVEKSQSVNVSRGGASLNGFKQPSRKWSQTSEAERHAAAINRANGWS